MESFSNFFVVLCFFDDVVVIVVVGFDFCDFGVLVVVSVGFFFRVLGRFLGLLLCFLVMFCSCGDGFCFGVVVLDYVVCL